jgi:hypothetical protein
VERLVGLYNPFRQFFGRRPKLSAVQKARRVGGRDPSRPQYRAERESGMDFRDREYRWDLGRIRYFVEQLERGAKLDPIEIDNQCDRGHIYGPILLDGHHRLCAAALLRTPTIRAVYGGRVDTLKYLTGKTPHPPGDLK